MLCEPCSHCEGRGYLLSSETVAYKVLREIRKDLPRFCGRRIALSVNRRVAERLLGPDRAALHGLEQELGREVEIRARADLHQEQFELVALDEGPPVPLALPWLSAGARGGRQETIAERIEERGESPEIPQGIEVVSAEDAPAPAEAVDAKEESLILAPSRDAEEA
jgi:hypothetical protein